MRTFICAGTGRAEKHSGPLALGFTLVQLRVVIAIIGLLAALLLPVLSKTKHKAQVKP